MKENERKRELLEQASIKPTSIKIKTFLRYYIPPNSIHFTKIYKSNTITGGESGKNIKRNQNVKYGKQFRRGCENSQPCEFGKVCY